MSRNTLLAGVPDPRLIAKKKSKISGWGVYASKKINKNKRITQYLGEKITQKECDRRSDIQTAKGELWVFEINRAWARDAAFGGNIARFINHSCKPNCYVEIVDHTIWIRAGKNIKPGEELHYDYNTGVKAMKCKCHSSCKNFI